MNYPLLAILFLIANALSQQTPFTLDPVFASNMVLQREPYQACLFGTANPGSYVYAELESKTTKVYADGSGKYFLCLPPHIPSDRAYTITITNSDDPRIIKLANVLFGDVYICSGQSNMEFTVRDAFSAEDAYAQAGDNRLVRYMTMERTSLPEPLQNISGHIRQPWSENSAANLGKGLGSYTYFSAVCYYYGLTIFQATYVPIGLIASSWGGTIVEAWSPKAALDACTDKVNPVADKNKHESLWNGQIYPFRRMTIKGAIFYQGEDNVGHEGRYDENKGYACSFPKMIEAWRKEFSSNGKTDPNFPFGFVQLAGYCSTGNHLCTANHKVQELRFAQLAERYEVPNDRLNNTFMATGIDLQDPLNTTTSLGDIHPRDKIDIGTRLGNAALKFIYGQNKPWTGPVLSGCSVENNQVIVSVKEEYMKGDNIISKNNFGFEIYTDSWVSVEVSALSPYSFILSIPDGVKPTQLRYLWKENPCCPEAYSTKTPFSCPMKQCNIYSKNTDLPMLPFIVNIVNGKCDMK